MQFVSLLLTVLLLSLSASAQLTPSECNQLPGLRAKIENHEKILSGLEATASAMRRSLHKATDLEGRRVARTYLLVTMSKIDKEHSLLSDLYATECAVRAMCGSDAGHR